MLDFATESKKCVEVRLKSGEIIRILPPSVKLMTVLMARTSALKNDDLEGLVSITAQIMSNNVEHKAIKPDDLGDYTIDEITMITNAVVEMITEVSKN